MKRVWRKIQIKKLEYTLWILTKGLKSQHPDFYLSFIPLATVVAVMLLFTAPLLPIVGPFFFSLRNYDSVQAVFSERPVTVIFLLATIPPTIYLLNSLPKWLDQFSSLPKWMGGDPDLDLYLKISETQAKLKALTDA